MSSSDLSGMRSQISESCSEPLRAGGRIMSSVATTYKLSRELGKIVAPDGGWKDQVKAIHTRLTDEKFEHRLENLTWNRVRSWFFGENRRADYEEVVALQELKALEEARRARHELSSTIIRLEALLAAPVETLDCDHKRDLGRLARALDRAGIKAFEGRQAA